MTDKQEYLGPLVVGDEIKTELRKRKQKDVFQRVTGSTKKLIAQKVELEEEDGWRTVRKNLKSTRMARAKPPDEQLEDEVWCVLAQMGFKEMSRGRQFTIIVDDALPPRQIDVFAKDDETVMIVECTRRNAPGTRSMAPLIEKIQAIREGLHNSILRAYGRQPRLKVKPVIATRNIAWSNVDLAKCAAAQIGVLTDGELDYYLELVKHIKQAARYQFLAHMFGGQKIEGLTKEVLATQGKMGGDTFYTFLIRPDELLKIAYVGHKASRDIENLATYQRMLQPHRLRKIGQYINDGGKFPTNIVVNLKTAKGTKLQFERKGKHGDEAWGTLHLPPNYASAWIIDGQHRLYGYVYARDAGGFHDDSTALPVLAYENLPAEKEMNLFIDINSKQVKVRTALLVELYADLHWCSSNPAEALQALHSRIASRLNSMKTSPLHERMVVTGKKKTHHRCLTTTSIQAGLRKANLLATSSKGGSLPGPLSTAKLDDYDANLSKALSVLSDCLGMFSTELANHWQLGDAPGGYLCTNNGIRALFHVIEDVAVHFRTTDHTDLCFFSANETFAEIKPYLQALVDYFKDAPTQEFQTFRDFGSSLAAVRRQAYGLEAHIQERIPSFSPPGLQKYLDTRDEEGTADASAKIRKIQQRLFDYVVGALKEHHGTKKKAWWTEGIPVAIQKDCTLRWIDKGREGEEESQLYLINYISICHHNWDLFKAVISLDAHNRDNKKANTKWIIRLNDIRNITAHPERGALSTEQVAFVNECLEKVEKFFPETVSQT